MTPLRLLFWNMGSKATTAMVGMLAVEYEPDVIILIDSEHGPALTIKELNVRTSRQYQIPFGVTDRFQFFVKMPADRVQPVVDGASMSIKDVHRVLSDSLILACAHLPSRLHLDLQEQAALCSRWVRHVCRFEARLGHNSKLSSN